MATVTLSKKELRDTVRKSVREAIGEELATLRAMFVSFVSDSEQKDIETRYGRPSHKVVRSRVLNI